MEPILEIPRAEARMDFFQPVRVFLGGDQRIDAFGLDVSLEGMRIRSNCALECGARVALEFPTRSGPIRIREAEVIWAQPFEPINVTGIVPGFGVRFLDVDHQSKECLEVLLQESEPPHLDAERFGKAEPEVVLSRAGEATDSEDAPLGAEIPDPSAVGDWNAPDLLPRIEKSATHQTPASRPTPHTDVGGHMASLASRILAAALACVGFLGLGIAVIGSEASASLQPEPSRVEVPADRTPDRDAKLPRIALPLLKAAVAAAETAAKPFKAEPLLGPALLPSKPKPALVVPRGLEAKPSANGWNLFIPAAPGLKTKAFALANPPRYVVDVAGAVQRGKAHTISPKVAGVSGIRVTPREGFVRYVVDFSRGRVPEAQATRTADGLAIAFTR